MSPIRPLKIAALDEEDLAVVSAHVQDAVVKTGDIKWSPHTGHFIIPMNRFAWEETAARPRRETDQRRRAVLQFDRVRKASAQGIIPGDREAVMAVLAILFEATDAPAGVIRIVGSGDALIRLEVECIEVRLTDLGSAWGAGMRPRHRTR